jgi:hypothetical protein
MIYIVVRMIAVKPGVPGVVGLSFPGLLDVRLLEHRLGQVLVQSARFESKRIESVQLLRRNENVPSASSVIQCLMRDSRKRPLRRCQLRRADGSEAVDLVAIIGDWLGTTDGSTSNEREPSKAECELHDAPKRLNDEREAFLFHHPKLYTSSNLT